MAGAKQLQEQLICDIRLLAHPITDQERQFVQNYLGTRKKFLNLKSKDRNKLLRHYLPLLRQAGGAETQRLLDLLFSSATFEHLNLAGKVFSLSPKVRSRTKFSVLGRWLASTHGWAECDSICQAAFTGQEVLERFDEWRGTIERFCRSPNIQLRRASLVLQVKPVRQLADQELRTLAFTTIETLKVEREILITKAVSWLLRSLSVLDKEETREYLERNKTTLPSIAYRETSCKILTGKKSHRRQP